MKVRSLIAMLVVLLAASGCASPGNLVGTTEDGTPIYSKSFTPTEGDGAVTINCAVGEDYRLTDCRVISEQPEGKGYGAIALAQVTRPEARLDNTFRPGARVQFTMRLRG